MQENKIEPQVDGTEPVVSEDTEAAVPARGKMTVSRILSFLSKAVNAGEVHSNQAAQIRRELGLTKRFFTKRKTSKSAARAKRKNAKAARRRNRGSGKGQKRTAGVHGS